MEFTVKKYNIFIVFILVLSMVIVPSFYLYNQVNAFVLTLSGSILLISTLLISAGLIYHNREALTNAAVSIYNKAADIKQQIDYVSMFAIMTGKALIDKTIYDRVKQEAITDILPNIGHQTWNGFPTSPLSSELYPYQIIRSIAPNWNPTAKLYYLGLSNKQLKQTSNTLRALDGTTFIYREFSILNENWTPSYQEDDLSNLAITNQAYIIKIEKSNFDILNNDLSAIYFQHTEIDFQPVSVTPRIIQQDVYPSSYNPATEKIELSIPLQGANSETGLFDDAGVFYDNLDKLLEKDYTQVDTATPDVYGYDGVQNPPIGEVIDKGFLGSLFGGISAILNDILQGILSIPTKIQSIYDYLVNDVPFVDQTDAMKGVITNKLGINNFSGTLARIQNMNTVKPQPPVIKINLNSLYNASVSRFTNKISPFESGEINFIDFGFMEGNEWSYNSMNLITLFRTLVGAGYAINTYFYIRRKIYEGGVFL